MVANSGSGKKTVRKYIRRIAKAHIDSEKLKRTSDIEANSENIERERKAIRLPKTTMPHSWKRANHLR